MRPTSQNQIKVATSPGIKTVYEKAIIRFKDKTTVGCSNKNPGTARSTEPTSICNPTIIRRFPPEDAPLIIIVAIVSEITAIMHSIIPKRSAPLCNLTPIIRATPNAPTKRPNIPNRERRSPKISHPKNPTAKGITDAIIEAKDASIDCIATKFKPR